MLSAMLLEVALVAFGGIGQASPAAEPPTRSGFPPFGLTYLPQQGPQGFIALRPAEIVRHFPVTQGTCR